jgi:hypothetical protein
LNATELAREKFYALFAAHDADDIRAAAQQKPSLKTVKKAAIKNVKPLGLKRDTLDSTS